MKIRLVSKEKIKKAYKENTYQSSIDLEEGLKFENIEKVPKELFQILGETLSYLTEIKKDEDEEKDGK